ncbi:MAG: replication-associated recombination protein A [Fibromonadaceae bacterium]|jgi:putative ATPase|nr:replication-associated recombination protein A [Fibromonadaceae bacterium]
MQNVPLAERMRPQNLDEFLGQQRILGETSMLRAAILSGNVPSMVFWGPPGCGKTSLANVIKTHSKKRFVALSAVASGVKEVKAVLDEARTYKENGRETILFIDEIHRFNKAQQDSLLGAVENGTVTLIGATTENPGFEVNSALLSRCQLILFGPLQEQDMQNLLESALRTHSRGLKRDDLSVSKEAAQKLVGQADGDARFLLNQLEWLAGTVQGEAEITLELMEQLQYEKPLRYDKRGEEHYNLISVLHKSVRGSDVQAAVYWLHRMLDGGEDPRYILRRLMRMAMEDIGLADPNALLLATAAREAFDFMGVPEGLIALDELTVYLSLAPKSNSLELMGSKVNSCIRQTGTLPVPKAFRNPVTKVGKDLGYGRGYKYDHDSPGAYAGQEHLPEKLKGMKFYEPTEHGREKALAERLKELEKRGSQTFGVMS